MTVTRELGAETRTSTAPSRSTLTICYVCFTLLALIPASGFTAVKAVLLAGFGSTAVLVLRRAAVRLPELLLGLGLPMLLVASLLLGVLQDTVDLVLAARAFVNYASVFLVVFLTYLLCRRDLATLRGFFVAVFVGNFCYLVLRASVLALTLSGVVTPEQVLRLAAVFTPGAGIQELEGAAMLTRVALVNDILTPFVFALTLVASRLGIRLSHWVRVPYYALAVAMMTATLTRYVWVIAVVAVVAYLALWPRALMRVVIVTALIATVSAGLVVRFAEPSRVLRAMAVLRLGDVESISIKQEQTLAILDELGDYPIFGKGVGGYVRTYVRDERLPFQYEVQWAGLLLQFGVLGVSVVIGYMLAVARGLRAGKVGRYLVLLYALWLASGFFNPYLSALSSSVVYGLFLVAGLHLARVRAEQPVVA